MINPRLFPIKGDIAREDALVLYNETKDAQSVMEIGIGGSTIFIACSTKAQFIALENHKEWISTTQKNLSLYKDHVTANVDIIQSDYSKEELLSVYNKIKPSVIFIDSKTNTRDPVLRTLFDHSNSGTIFLIHDCRDKRGDGPVRKMIGQFTADYLNEIEVIVPQIDDSNIVKIIKSEYKPYYNWNLTEKEGRIYWDKTEETGLEEYFKKINQ